MEAFFVLNRVAIITLTIGLVACAPESSESLINDPAMEMASAPGETNFPSESGNLVISTELFRLMPEPGTSLPLSAIIGDDAISQLGTEGVIEIFDAHCGRGYIEIDGMIQRDRVPIEIPATATLNVVYIVAGTHNEYDHLRYRLTNSMGTSDWGRISIIAKGRNDPTLAHRARERWRRNGDICEFLD